MNWKVWKMFSNSLLIHLNLEISGPITDRNSELKCRFCDMELINTSLSYHLKSVHPSENSHYCYICNKHFNDLKPLKKHLRLHGYGKHSQNITMKF